MKAADIPDVAMLRVLAGPRICATDPGYNGVGSWSSWDVPPQFPGVPAKVVLAKVHRLIKRGLVDGCDCGCRGDFEVTAKGRDLLRAI